MLYIHPCKYSSEKVQGAIELNSVIEIDYEMPADQNSTCEMVQKSPFIQRETIMLTSDSN